MISDQIIYYDDEFIKMFEKMKDVIAIGDKSYLHKFLIDNLGYIFSFFQYYANEIAEGNARDFEEADDETKLELMRPLSYRQYRMIERSFSIWKGDEEEVISSIWDFLHDYGRIYDKKVMSSAEVSACSLILEQVYSCLTREYED